MSQLCFKTVAISLYMSSSTLTLQRLKHKLI